MQCTCFGMVKTVNQKRNRPLKSVGMNLVVFVQLQELVRDGYSVSQLMEKGRAMLGMLLSLAA